MNQFIALEQIVQPYLCSNQSEQTDWYFALQTQHQCTGLFLILPLRILYNFRWETKCYRYLKILRIT